jgi:leader peptidase (prepilin peptidase)/N-methyltransferase
VTAFPIVVITLFGLMLGSFLNVLIHRLPLGESIVFPGSRCPHCRTRIRAYDNVPVFSYVLLGGKCRACRTPISMRYPLVEAATAAAFCLQALVWIDWPLVLAQRLVFTGLLVALFGTDLETQRLPNALTLPGIAIGLVFALAVPPGLVDALIGAALGAAILWVIRWGWYRATGVEAMGLGDVKMLAMIGAFLGWRQVWLVLFLASVSGAVLGVGLAMARGRSMQTRLPFGTFLAIAAFIASVVGDRLLEWYLGSFQI